MSRKGLALVMGALVFGATAPAGAGELLRLDDPISYEIQAVGFELTRDAEITVEGLGARPGSWSDMIVYGWILDTRSREPVWEMTRRTTDRERGTHTLRRANEKVDLDAGTYELYFYSGEAWSGSYSYSDGWRGWVRGWWHDDDDDWRDLEDEIDQCYIAIASDALSASDIRQFEVTGGFDDALIRFNKVGDSERLQQGFELSRPSTVHLYSLIEYPRGDHGAADYAWIVREEDRDVVWRADKRNTRRAGGGDKNRVYNDDVDLEAGRYVLHYGTDDSHSYEEFNTAPPNDPLNWGVTMSPGPGFDRSAFSLFTPAGRGEPVISFTRAGDYDFFEQPFRLAKSGDVHIYALGEMGYSDRDFADYAWIADARGGITWEMTYRNTMAAGGAEKNRMFDDRVSLEAGEYVLYYVTDDSHSWDDWNSATPFDPEAWGVQLFATSGVAKSDIQLLDVQELTESGDQLVRMVRVGDHERRRQRFTLDSDTRVHIYCLGEGTGGEMYDYGYIIDDDTGRTVWEMRYRRTRHAGGARKNRMYDGEITLDAGTYIAFYETDGSHSFEDWNARRPRDSMNWGLTISKLEGGSSTSR